MDEPLETRILLRHARRAARLLIANAKHADDCLAIALETILQEQSQNPGEQIERIELFHEMILTWQRLFEEETPCYVPDPLKLALHRISAKDRLLLVLCSIEILEAHDICTLLDTDAFDFRRQHNRALVHLESAIDQRFLICGNANANALRTLIGHRSVTNGTTVTVPEPDALPPAIHTHLPNVVFLDLAQDDYRVWEPVLAEVRTWWLSPIFIIGGESSRTHRRKWTALKH